MKVFKCGVIQGSILGPLLFPIFGNYLNNSTKVLDPVLFADDAKLVCSDSILIGFLKKKTIHKCGKTKYMLFHKLTGQDNIPLKWSSLQLNGNIIERKNSLKFLVLV